MMNNRIHRRVSTQTLHYGREGLYWWGQIQYLNGKFIPLQEWPSKLVEIAV
jgi:hypothetical protein